ncbi:hypothetical protein BN1051_00342 [Arthrobacter saudimassiliensis]|uniref:Thiopeptide-type bacteriocin biosynthesis domain-containing protein n=1 Tax=Arthrobacter saudimassiliensis TaxID=1461584 RepID=A0A078MI58_9MICC|nr:hypothetical protein BN1051_00342 [Arthrobacter saudimassiliensis]
MSLTTHAQVRGGRISDGGEVTRTVITTRVPGDTEADRACSLLLTPLAAQARQWQSHCWHFSRRPQRQGVVLETQFAGTRDSGRRLTSFLAALLEQTDAELGRPETAVKTYQGTPGTVAVESSGDEAALLFRLGGPDGLALAEEVFELSSDLSLWAVGRFTTPATRRALLALLMFDAAEAMMRGPRSTAWPDRRRVSWDFFWDTHLDAALRRVAPTSGHASRIFHRNIASQLNQDHAVMLAAASERSVYNWRRRWQRAIDRYLYRADKSGVSRCAQHLTLHQIHETAGRMGLGPHAEAAAGIQARHWAVERERTLQL